MRLVGTTSKPFSFRVEVTKVREFARAILDPFAELPEPPVPATFPMYGVADFERQFFFDVLGLDRSRTLNAGQEYAYARPLRIGDQVECTASVTDEFVKTSTNSGEMRFVVIETKMHDTDGQLILTSTATIVEISSEPRKAST